MALEQVSLVTVATCDLCSASAVHASSAASALAQDYFLGLGWSVISGSVPTGDTVVDAEAWLCPRCTPLWLAGTATGVLRPGGAS